MIQYQLVLSAAGTIFTYAGNGKPGKAGGGRQATTAYFQNPRGMSVDARTGNLYVADTFNAVVRMINKTTGIITTVAGGGSTERRGDGVPAVLASLSYPYDVATDPFNGNIYIADIDAIRLVTMSTGIITTIAGNNTRAGYTGDGGLATQATLSFPQGIDIDPSTGNLYIADTNNNAIRMITRGTGIITTIAGNGNIGYSGDGGPATSATLNSPNDIAFDAATGNIYIADTDNFVIRMVTWRTGIITTFAGVGDSGYSGDGGLATLASFRYPRSVAVDASSGNLYVADTRNNAIRMITRGTGIITTIAGNGNIGYSGDGGPATSATLYAPYGVVADASSGMIYIADTNNYVVRTAVGTSTTAVSSPAMAPTVKGEVKGIKKT